MFRKIVWCSVHMSSVIVRIAVACRENNFDGSNSPALRQIRLFRSRGH